MTLADYIKAEYSQGKIDFALRAHVWDGKVHIYIHPAGKDGMTTSTLEVVDDTVIWPT